jgi:putative ABC transport system ATP-binding protein
MRLATFEDNVAVIQTFGVTKTYASGGAPVNAVRGVDLRVEKGEFLAIVGPSGSGKSSLLSLIGGIDTPTTGQVLLEGVDLATLTDDARTIMRRRRIGFIFQAFNLLPTLSAVENVALALELDGLRESEAWPRAEAAIESVGLAARGDHLPSMMSGGEQQRVAVARALVINPALVLADEPTGNLDSVASKQVVQLLRDLVDKQGQTVVIVTHDLQLAEIADRTVRVRDGLIESVVPRRKAPAVVVRGSVR